VLSVPLGEPIERYDTILFSESNSRFVVEVAPVDSPAFERRFKGLPCACVGVVKDERSLCIMGSNRRLLLKAGLDELKAAWKRPLDW